MTLRSIRENGLAVFLIALLSIIGAGGFGGLYVAPGMALAVILAMTWGERMAPAVFLGTLLAESLGVFFGLSGILPGIFENILLELLFLPVGTTLSFYIVCKYTDRGRSKEMGLTESQDLLRFMISIALFSGMMAGIVTFALFRSTPERGLGFFLMLFGNALMLSPFFFYVATEKLLLLLKATKHSRRKLLSSILLVTLIGAAVLSPATRNYAGDFGILLILPMMLNAVLMGQGVNSIQMVLIWGLGMWGFYGAAASYGAAVPSEISFGIYMITLGTVVLWVTAISEKLKKRSLYLEVQNEIHIENEERIRSSEKRLEAIFRSSPIIITLTNLKTGIVVDCNEQAEKYLGYEREELIGMSAFDIGLWDSAEEQENYVRGLKQFGRVTDYEMNIMKKNGERRVFSGSTEQIEIEGQSFALTALLDITEKKQSQDRMAKFAEELEMTVRQRTMDLNDAKEFNDKVLKNSPVGILTYNSEGRCIIANEAASRIVGESMETLMSYNYLTGGIWEKIGLRELADETMRTGGEGIMEANLEELKKTKCWQEFRTAKFVSNNEEFLLLMTSDITARKEAEQALKKAETQIRNMTNELPLVVYQSKFTNNGIRITFINDSCYRMLGITRGSELNGETILGLLHPDEREEMERLIYDAAGKKLPWRGDFRAIVEGKSRWFHCESVPVEMENGEILWNGYIQDTTERREAEEDINLFFRTAIDLMAIEDHFGQFKRVSPSWAEVLGWSEDELIGKPFADFVHPEDRGRVLAEQRKLNEGNNIISFTARFRCSDGSYRWLDWNSHNQQEREVVLSVVRDITEAKQLEQVLIEAKNTAESADRAKSEFLANMSHEIRTPLNAVIGFSEILGDQATDPKQKVYLESINTAGKSLLRLINDILDLSKIEAGMMVMNYSPVNPRNILHEIEQIFRMEVERKGIQFLLDIDENIPKVLILDEARVRQVLLNLVGNAVKFTDKGYVKLRVVKRSIDAEGKRIDLIIAVQDTGIGINKHELEEVFNAFRQQYGQSDRKYGGTGLGLSISKRLVELMNGRIELESELGIGSTFTVYIRDINVASFERIEHPEVFRRRVRFNGERVLVVDDVESNRELVREQLSMVGLRVYTAFNGEDAIYKVENYGPELILMDLMMPIMDGEEAARQIKDNESTAHIPIVALTASTRIKSMEELRSSPFSGHLSKPVSAEQLYEEVRRFIPAMEVEVEPEVKVQEGDGKPDTAGEGAGHSAREDQVGPEKEKLDHGEIEHLKNKLGLSLDKLNKGLRRSLVIELAKELFMAGEELSNKWVVAQAEELKTAINNTDIETATHLIQQLHHILYSDEK